MEHSEFDKFADEYVASHARNIRISGENPSYFAEYKVRDFATIAAALGLRGSLRILDFGCGVGACSEFFRAYFPESRVVGVDVSERSLEIARDRGIEGFEPVLFDGRELPFEAGEFDLAFAACVFHHIRPEQHAAQILQVAKVLRPGGLIFIYEHNPLNPFTVRAVRTCPFDENAVLIPHRAMKHTLAEAGLVDIKVRHRVFFPGFAKRLRFLERYLEWLPLGAQYSICARRPVD